MKLLTNIIELSITCQVYDIIDFVTDTFYSEAKVNKS